MELELTKKQATLKLRICQIDYSMLLRIVNIKLDTKTKCFMLPTHVPRVTWPFSQLVGADNTYPVLQTGEHVEPEAKVEVQLPASLPFCGIADASHDAQILHIYETQSTLIFYNSIACE